MNINEVFNPYNLSPKSLLEYRKTRRHFIERLKERYGIHIDEFEYDELINEKPNHKFFYKLSSSIHFCSISIKGQTVKCIYRGDSRAFGEYIEKPRGFITCITDNMPIPTPYMFTHDPYNITPEIFLKAFKVFEQKAKELSAELLQKGSKAFFMETNYNKTLKTCAKRALLGEPIEPRFVVNYYFDNINELLKLKETL